MTSTVPSMDRSASFLRLALIADAVISGATGLMLTFGADLATGLLGLPAPLLRYAGMSLLPFAVVVAAIGTRETVSRPAVWAVIVYNTLWATDSILLLASGWVAPTALGYAFTVAQALAVAILAQAQFVGLRKWAAA